MAEIEKQMSIRSNSNECYYNKWKPLIDKAGVYNLGLSITFLCAL